jgi:hypothetical protein
VGETSLLQIHHGSLISSVMSLDLQAVEMKKSW